MALDTQLFFFLNAVAGWSPLSDAVVVFFAAYLSYVIPCILLLFVLVSAYPRREKIEILLVAAVSATIARYGVTELVRLVYHRPRPFLVSPVHQLLTSNEWSFPSGHAAVFFALATVVYLYHKKWGIFFFIAAVLMTTSRVIAGIHYPSDILGGALVGIGAAYATTHFFKKVVPIRPS